ncbi:hypothetical protein [Allocoleopsis sp.]|uniref:hypothetical protein n=1 Tax=Allocoleopsis sp. TaxID=3088169 RepID=UPI002FD04145
MKETKFPKSLTNMGLGICFLRGFKKSQGLAGYAGSIQNVQKHSYYSLKASFCRSFLEKVVKLGCSRYDRVSPLLKLIGCDRYFSNRLKRDFLFIAKVHL